MMHATRRVRMPFFWGINFAGWVFAKMAMPGFAPVSSAAGPLAAARFASWISSYTSDR